MVDIKDELSKKTYARLSACMGGGVDLEEVVTTLLDFWDEENEVE